MRPFVAAVIVVAGLAPAASSAAQTIAPNPAPSANISTRWSLKGTGVASEASRDGLWRARVEPTLRLGSRTTFDLAYEQRIRFSSTPVAWTSLGLGVLPAEAPPPYRLTPLDWEIAGSQYTSWRHEVDRAALHTSIGKVGLNAGRQAVGWGRGVIFGAVDLFSPFSPFEVDREWRRGVDAVRIEAPLASHASGDAVAAFGAHVDESAYAGRIRGYAGTIDLEVAGGWRARDTFGGATSSFVIGPAEIHAEIAAFRTPAVKDSALFGVGRTVVKAVVGGSTRLAVGSGLLVNVEYHYSGFGADGARAIVPALTDPEFAARVGRGDTQILTRHALAFVASYEWSPLTASSTALVLEPTDGSGILTPSLSLTFSDRWSLVANAYLAFGANARGGILQSAYGNAPATAVVQVRFYR